MDLLFGSLKFLLFLSLVSFSSVLIIKLLKIDDIIEKIILIFVFNWVQIILIIQVLSLFHKVSNLSLIITHIVICTFILIITIIKKVSIKINPKYLWGIVKDKYRNLKITKILKIIILIWLIVIIVSTFFIGITVPPKNFDSMTYHLTRAAFWKQNQSLDHYFTRNVRQVENPMNSEIGVLWVMILTNSDWASFLIQWTALLIILLVLYKLLKLIGFNSVISFVVSFLFTSFNMVVYQSSSTQNDLIAACFLILTLYFIIKSFKVNILDFKYLIIAGLVAGIAIGTKGYIYLFIPGFIFFILIYYKNTKIKWKKITFLISFSIVGIFLFASYNWIENYMSFGNIFNSPETTELLRISNPDLKTFVSNSLRQLASFYQLKNYDLDTISGFLEKSLNYIHNRLNISISSPETTWIGQNYYISSLGLNMDVAYFGPIYSLIIIPSIIYNFLIFMIFRKIRKDKVLVKKYKDTLKILVIPIVFFIAYTFIFKWQPWAGRLMIGFALLMMVSFSVFLEFLFKINKKYLFNIFISLIIFISIIFSGKVLFNSWDPRILPIGGRSIYSVVYDERRFVEISVPHIRDVKNMVDSVLDKDSSLGLLTSNDDWDYIYFGKNFDRKLIYISDEEYIKKDIVDIIAENNLDGILINNSSVPSISESSLIDKKKDVEFKSEAGYSFFYK